MLMGAWVRCERVPDATRPFSGAMFFSLCPWSDTIASSYGFLPPLEISDLTCEGAPVGLGEKKKWKAGSCLGCREKDLYLAPQRFQRGNSVGQVAFVFVLTTRAR